MRKAARHLVILIVITLASTSAAQIPCLSGFVRDGSGSPVVGADLDFTNAVTGVRLVTPGDNTDEFGFYSVCVLPGNYHVTYAPPPGTRLMGKRFDNVDLTSGREINVTLDFGTVVTGLVSTPTGAPIGGVDIDVDRVTGGRIYTPDDDTDPLLGTYRVVIPNGVFRFRFEPPLGSRWRGLQIDSVTVSADRTVDATLVEGFLLRGRVTDRQGAGLFDIDVDLREWGTGAKVFIANNSTDPAGDYDVAVPLGVFQLRFSPPRGSRYVGASVDSFVVTSDTDWNQTLDTGIVVTAIVQDLSGNPIPGADLDFKLERTGEKPFTPNDGTDAQGTADVTVLPDVYTIEVDPPIGTLFDQLIVPGVSIQRDTTIVFQLSEVARVAASGRVANGAGGGIAGVEITGHLQPTNQKVFIAGNVTDATGAFDVMIPIGTYEMAFAPPAGSRYVGRKLKNVSVAADSAWGTIMLEEGWLVTVDVTDEAGLQVAGADLDFVSETVGGEVFTPHDNTNARGRATVAVPSDLYTLVVTAPTGSGLNDETLTSLRIQNDTTLTVVLSQAAEPPPDGVLLRPNQPNPFRGLTSIPYEVTDAGNVSVKVYNVLGQLVAVLENGFHPAGSFTTQWDGTGVNGGRVAGGVYFVRLQNARGVQTRKIALVR